MYTYLALGDSYTIGEMLPIQESFPYQTVQLLKERHIEVAEPVIIAQTGWTTDELAMAVREEGVREKFDLVSLLIGVNNQYRERSVEDYKKEFTQLLEQAISFANGKARKVFVLSIPDWGATPFAVDRDRNKIAAEIDAYNKSNKEITEAYHCNYLDITGSTREHGNSPEFLAEDGLHPSSKAYAIWANQLAKQMEGILKG